MNISVIHPSYGRPKLAMQTANKWLSRAGKKIEYILCLSNLDPKLKEYEVPEGIEVIYSDHANMVKQMNLAASHSTGDLLVSISDDFDCPKDWAQTLGQAIPFEDVVVRIDDGVRNPGVQTDKIIPLPIMDRKYYSRFGYIYHPDYNHFYGDEELFRVGVILGRKLELPLLFEHIHPVTGRVQKDDVNLKNNAFHATDKETFKKREAKGFDLKKLSILIPTLSERRPLLLFLIQEIEGQIFKLNAKPLVEILLHTDSRQLSVGKKRNVLLRKASGDYITFIDDDDKVNESYIGLLLHAIQYNPDCCSLNGLLFFDSGATKVFKHSIEFKGWYERDGILYRFPNHLNCVKASIAKQMTFPDSRHGEDKKYSEQLEASKLLKTEIKIEETLYYYHYTKNK